MKSENLLELFIFHFKKLGYKLLAPSPLTETKEKNTLFTIAGMQQFTSWFLRQQEPEYEKVITIQPCLRISGKQNDIEEIGQTKRHNTFFEMLGSFVFKNVIKEQNILDVWTFLTEVINKNFLMFTVYDKDEEAYEICKKLAPTIKLNSNIWKSGDNGPYGPCVEIFYNSLGLPLDKAKEEIEKGSDCCLELWNIVFIEGSNGENLPHKGVDTGGGFLRICSVINNSLSNYETDLLKPLVEKAKEYSLNMEDAHMLADHCQSIAFLLSEKLTPATTKKGHVLRRLIRKSLLININLEDIIKIFINNMKGRYPLLEINYNYIMQIIQNEKKLFLNILNNTNKYFNTLLKKYNNHTELMFKLYETYGIPIPYIQKIFKEKNMEFDLALLQKYMKQHQKKSKNIL